MLSHTTEYMLARGAEERKEVYQLRYQCYRRKQSIEERSEAEFSDAFDEQPNSFSFLARTAGRTVATVRITVVQPDLGWTDAPVHHVYGDHPAFQEIAASSFVESSRLCFDCMARRDSFVGLVGHMAAAAEFYGVQWIVACPRLEHSPIYQRMFGFRPLAAPRRYFGVSFETQLLGIRLTELRDYVSKQRPMLDAWSAALDRLFPTVPR